MVLISLVCYLPLLSQAARTEKVSTGVDAGEYAEMMGNEAYDLEDLAEGAEIQRRMFNRMTPPGYSWLQPMFPSVVPFSADNYSESFLEGLLGVSENSVAIYPLSLVLDPKTRKTLVYNAEGELIATVPAERISHVWPEGYDPARVTLLLDLLPSEDVEPYLYVKERILDSLSALTSKFKSPKSGGYAMKSLGSTNFGICDYQKLTNGNMQLTVTNGGTVAEIFSYTVLHSASNVVTSNGTNTLWYPVSPPFNGLESEWDCRTNNLLLTNGVGVWVDSNISSNDRVRFYGAAKQSDSDLDGLTDGMELFVYHTDPDDPDTDGDGWSDAEELNEEDTDPLDKFSATKLARGVVINEVLYNATGTDADKEWVELYSAGRYPVDLGGFVIQVGDLSFTNAYEIPTNTVIQPGRYLLLGGSLVTNNDLEVEFTMPNRFTNGPTAAVRLAAEIGTNTAVADCLMYGGSAANFNSNGLDTNGWVSADARSAGAGNSLLRLFAGHDTDQVLDWKWQSSPEADSSTEEPDSDNDGLTDQEEVTGSENPHGQATDHLNADSDGDVLNDYSECVTHSTDPNTWATDGDLFPWPPTNNYAVSNWWGSDSYETANGWNPLVYDENTNSIPDSWEMAFPGTNLYADADGDGISNYDELTQNSDPFDDTSTAAQPFVVRFESSLPGWENDGLTDVGLNGWVKIYFEGLKTNADLCVWVKECRTQEEFRVEWLDANHKNTTWYNDDREVITSASALAGSRPYLLVQDLGLHPDYTSTLGGEYTNAIIQVDLDIWNGGSDLDNGETAGSQGVQVPEGSEVSTGAYILVNWDDDDGDGEINSATDGWSSDPTPDLYDSSVTDEDNLAKLVPTIEPLLSVGTVELEISGTDKEAIRLWTDSSKGTSIPLISDKVSWDISDSSDRSELQGFMLDGIWVEGTNACTVERGITITLRYKDVSGNEMCSDSNKATVVLLRLGCGVHRLGASANEWIAGMGHAGLITAFTGSCVQVELVDPTKYTLTEMQMAPGPGGVQHPTWRQFYDAGTNYWGEYDSDPTFVERLKILGVASHLDSMGVTYNLVDLLEHGGFSWDGSLSDLDELRCEGLVEVCHEWNDCNAWGEIHSGSVHYSVVTYCEEHEAAIGSLLNWEKHIFPATQCAEESTYKGADWDTDFSSIDLIEPLSVTW
jgi:hypothetical protein